VESPSNLHPPSSRHRCFAPPKVAQPLPCAAPYAVAAFLALTLLATHMPLYDIIAQVATAVLVFGVVLVTRGAPCVRHVRVATGVVFVAMVVTRGEARETRRPDILTPTPMSVYLCLGGCVA